MANAPQRDELLQRAMAALQARRADEAARIADDILRGEPRHPRALQIRGCALLMQGKPREAIAPLEESARVRHDAETDTQLAIALRQSGRPDDALSRLKRAIKRKPPYAAAFHELGYLLVSLERYDEAIAALGQGLATAPMMPELSIQLGHALLRSGRRVEAKMAFGRALAIAPSSLDALLGMGTAHSEAGEYAPAAECFRRCLMSRPDDAGLWLKLGHCLLAIGQRDAGIDCFRTAARGDPGRAAKALASLVKSGHGRFWLKPSDAAKFFNAKSSQGA